MEHYVYQRVHTLNGKPLHLAAHLDLAARAFEHIYCGERPGFDPGAVASRIAALLHTHRSPARGSATVMLRFSPADDELLSMEFERTLLDTGHTHSPLRPRAVSYEYSIPFGGFPTNFQLEARALFDTIALSQHGATRSVRRQGDRLLSCGEAPLFAIRGRLLFTAPLIEGAMDSVERRLVIAAAASSRLTVREEAIPHSGLKSFDELFFADAGGITSLAECDGAKFMSLAAARLAAAIQSPR
jgi:hypothetical protein